MAGDLIRFQCPSCGAELPPAPLANEQSCEYCGSRFAPQGARAAKTVAGERLDPAALVAMLREAQERAQQAQERAEQAQMRAAEAEAESEREQRRAHRRERRAKRSVIGWILSSLMTLTIIGVTLGSIVMVFVEVGLLTLPEFEIFDRFIDKVEAELSSESIDPWAGPPMLATISGEPAVVVRVRDGESLYVDAYALPDAARRWRIGPLSRGDRNLDRVRFTIAGPWVVVSEASPRLHVHTLEAGARVRSVDLRDGVDYLCTKTELRETAEAGSAPEVYVRSVRRRHQLLDPETGELERETKAPLGCGPERGDDFDGSVFDLDRLRGRSSFAGDGVELLRAHVDARVHRGVVLARAPSSDGASNRLVALGLVLPDEDAKSNKKKKKGLDAGEPSYREELAAAAALGPSTLAAGRVFVSWSDAEGRALLRASNLDDGAELWSKTVELEVGERVVSLHADAEFLLVARTHVLELRDAATGEVLGTIGEVPS